MPFVTAVLFAVGAGIGAPLRFALDRSIGSRVSSGVPLGTLAVNVLGSAVLGVVVALGERDAVGESVALVVGTAFCGALTTFSTFAYETVRLLEDGATSDAVATIALNVATTMAFAAAGYAFTMLLA